MSRASEFAREAGRRGLILKRPSGVVAARVSETGDCVVVLTTFSPQEALELADWIYSMFSEEPPSEDVPF